MKRPQNPLGWSAWQGPRLTLSISSAGQPTHALITGPRFPRLLHAIDTPIQALWVRSYSWLLPSLRYSSMLDQATPAPTTRKPATKRTALTPESVCTGSSGQGTLREPESSNSIPKAADPQKMRLPTAAMTRNNTLLSRCGVVLMTMRQLLIQRAVIRCFRSLFQPRRMCLEVHVPKPVILRKWAGSRMLGVEGG